MKRVASERIKCNYNFFHVKKKKTHGLKQRLSSEDNIFKSLNVFRFKRKLTPIFNSICKNKKND